MQVLIFTQYVRMLDILDRIIQQRLYTKAVVLQGSMGRDKRDAAVRRCGRDKFELSLSTYGLASILIAAAL